MTMQTDGIISVIDTMRGKSVSNYVIAGLTSTLIDKGKLRLFECDREHYDFITPHSHRYDLACIVISGEVRNTIYKYVLPFNPGGDEYVVSTLKWDNDFGSFHKTPSATPEKYKPVTETYVAGMSYYMSSDDIHSIRFSKGAKVLVIEGPQLKDTSVCLEPLVNGEHIVTLETKPYMFKEL